MSDDASLDDRSAESRVSKLVDEYMERLERGERPDVAEYVRRHPDLGGVLLEVLPALEALRASTPDLALGSPREVFPEEGELGTLGDFQLVREVGRGGMGVVYEARQISLRRRVALKVLPFAAALDARQLLRFKNEAQAAAQLHHPNIVSVYAVGQERGVHYYAMQYIDGRPLTDLIEERRRRAGAVPAVRGPAREPEPVPPSADTAVQPAAACSTLRTEPDPGFFRSAARLGVQAARALEHAHQVGIIHRDVKPANLLIDGDGKPWVADFGLAHVAGNPGLTASGDLLGTLRYMSPEQALGRRGLVDHRTDVYALGATLYELLTLTPAFASNDRQELLHQIAFEDPVPLRRINAAIPIELETIVLKAMAKEQAERYATAQELADDLQRYLDDRPIRARPLNLLRRFQRWTRRHRPLVASLAISIGLFLLGGVAVAVSYALGQAELAERRDAERKEEVRRRQDIARRYYDSLLAGADALRRAREPGYRKEVWHNLREANQQPIPGRDLVQLRAQAVACLGDPVGLDRVRPPANYHAATVSLPDALGKALKGWPAGTLSAASADGHYLACWHPSSPVLLSDQQGALRACAEATLGHVFQLVMTPDGSRLIAACEAGVLIWKVPALVCVAEMRIGTVRSIAVHPNGRLLAMVGRGLELYSLSRGRPLWQLAAPPEGTRVAFSADGRLLLILRDDRPVAAWPVSETPEKRYLDGHQEGVPAVAFSPNGKQLASVSKDRTVKVWDTTTGALLRTLRGHTQAIEAVAYHPDGSVLVTGDTAGSVHFWDPSLGLGIPLTARPTSTLPGQIWRLAFSPNGEYLVAAGDKGIATFRLQREGVAIAVSLVAELFVPNAIDCAVHPNGKELVFLDRSGKLYCSELRAGALARLLVPAGLEIVRSLRFDTTGERLFFVGKTGTVAVLDWREKELAETTRQKAFHLDVHGKWLVTSTGSNSVLLYDVARQAEVLTLPPEESEIWCCTWSRDGTHLAVSLADGGIVIWDLDAVCETLAEFGLGIPSFSAP